MQVFLLFFVQLQRCTPHLEQPKEMLAPHTVSSPVGVNPCIFQFRQCVPDKGAAVLLLVVPHENHGLPRLHAVREGHHSAPQFFVAVNRILRNAANDCVQLTLSGPGERVQAAVGSWLQRQSLHR